MSLRNQLQSRSGLSALAWAGSGGGELGGGLGGGLGGSQRLKGLPSGGCCQSAIQFHRGSCASFSSLSLGLRGLWATVLPASTFHPAPVGRPVPGFHRAPVGAIAASVSASTRLPGELPARPGWLADRLAGGLASELRSQLALGAS